MTFNFYPYLILVGASILAATAWLLHRARVQTHLSQELVKLNEEVKFDLPDFLRKCWPVLSRGGFSGIEWQLEWFGATLSESRGAVAEGVLEQTFQVEEIRLKVNLYHNKRGWEQHYFSRVMGDNFFLLLRMDMWIKLGTVRGTFDQTAKMTVFLQHDMKNLLQLVSLAADQLENQIPGQEKKLLSSLAITIPATRERAKHMLQALVSDRNRGARKSISLAAMLQESATMFELPLTILGDATVTIPEESLYSIIENLLGNYAWQHRQIKSKDMDLKVQIEKNRDSVLARISDVNGKPCLWPERLFEPFWSEHGKGRGIGLYQARQLATASGGTLDVGAPQDGPVMFLLRLPAEV